VVSELSFPNWVFPPIVRCPEELNPAEAVTLLNEAVPVVSTLPPFKNMFPGEVT